MKIVITAVTSPPQGGVVGAPLPQTLQVDGSILTEEGTPLPFGHDLVLVFEGTMLSPPVQILREPGSPGALPGAATLQLSKTGAIATVNVPVPTQGSPSLNPGKVWAVSGGMVSDEFDFPVGRS